MTFETLRRTAVGVAALLCCAAPSWGAELTVDGAKQILNEKLMKLKPASAAERNVLFQDIRIVAKGGGSYQVTVSASVRDYEQGFPRNRYYGRTCVGNFQNEQYTISPASTGGWLVDGRLTPDLSKTQCKDNPSAGVSSILLSALSGSAAVAGTVSSPAMARSGGVAEGSYECWSGRNANMMLNFAILAGGRYTDSKGHGGTFTFTPGSQKIAFAGGALDGGAGYAPVYYEPQGRPTVSFRNPTGDEVAFCQKK